MSIANLTRISLIVLVKLIDRFQDILGIVVFYQLNASTRCQGFDHNDIVDRNRRY